MSLTKQEFSNYIKQFNFRELFNDMGWNNDRTTQPITVDNTTYILQAVAEKSGFKILLCHPLTDGRIPDYNTRKKIESKVTKLFQEHLIIFFDSSKSEQVWQVVVRQAGKPTKMTETRYHISQDPELLYQRTAGIFFELDEEEHITIIDVTKRVAENFHQNNEKVTKRFYDGFKKEHTAFLEFIEGIGRQLDKDWYASLMLNRLMFCYFIQKRGFLNNDKNYLRTKLESCKEKKGKNKFYSFYRNFLLALFHQGLGAPDHNKELKEEIGRVPYLNGGLFDEHELEKVYKGIDIDDNAFERLFDFFDQYEWHLDTRHTASGKDINPDVIGYIFEKYINDRAQMGAYYTKEDITDYISKNCIIPYLFDETKRQHPKAFAADDELWQTVKHSGDAYIYDAVKKGVELPLSDEIAVGEDTTRPNLLERRKAWNNPAPPEYTLPTEIWREVVERRNRYDEVKANIKKGEILYINDFVTYNLNIRQFAQDVIANTTDPEFLRHFYKTLNNITIIDPTCGSGAFLFAALNILEPLYAGCIQRMESFVAEAPKGKFKFFEEVLAQVNGPEHPNLDYFIYKSIILRNLYGVDIMKEAVEIAKLRLFLKLVATVEADYRKPNLGLEPLPDIDFNIRAGNTLVGFGGYDNLEKLTNEDVEAALMKNEIVESCEKVKMAFDIFKNGQLIDKSDYSNFKEGKEQLNKELKSLNERLNHLLHKQFAAIPYDQWLKTHQPFHWFAEFYEIIQDKGGFDVIIGNPPYVNFKKIEYSFKESEYVCYECKDLFALTIERSFSVIKAVGRNGFIIPLSGLSTESMLSLRKLIFRYVTNTWNSYFSASDQPASLFNGVRHRLLITINHLDKSTTNISNQSSFSTNFQKWFSSERDALFERAMKYIRIPNRLPNNSKISSQLETSILTKLNSKRPLSHFVAKVGSPIYYHNAPVHWGKIFDFVPYYSVAGIQQQSSHLKTMCFNDQKVASVVICLLNSTLFYWYNWQYSNCRDLSQKDILRMPISLDEFEDSKLVELVNLKNRLMNDLKHNSKLYRRVSKGVQTEFDSFYPMLSKPIIDEIDRLFAKHYSFTDEEFDFIINYDIKYRMGKELDNEEAS